MSQQLGEQLGLGVAPDRTLVKVRHIIGCYKINAAPVAVPRLLCITKDGGDQTPANEGLDAADTKFQENGRFKKFGIYLKTLSGLTGDAELVLRINGGDAFILPIPQATPAQTTLLTADNIDIEFLAGDSLNFILRMVSGVGSFNMSWSSEVEFDSDFDGDFPADIDTYTHITPAILAVRRNITALGVWLSIDLDQPVFPALYNGNFKAVGCSVPTGFNILTAKLGRAYRVRAPATQTSFLQTDFIIGETGTKITLGDGTQLFVSTDTFSLQSGQSGGGTLEPINTIVVIQLEKP